MVVPLRRVFAQQPPIAAVLPIVKRNTSLEGQLAVLQALDGVDDRFREEILRHLVQHVERTGSDEDIAEEVWEAYYALKTPDVIRRLRESSDSVVRYELPHGKHIAIRENRSTLIEKGGTGHRTWESSLALAELMCTTQFETWDEVIELGAGTGLVGLVLAKMGRAKSVRVTDGSPALVAKLEHTIGENELDTVVSASVLQWEDLDEAARLPKHAVVVAGDVLYGLPSLYHVILDCLVELRPSKALLANPIRNAESYETFKTMCFERSIDVKVLAHFSASSVEESDWMFLVSLPPIPLEVIELRFPAKGERA